MARTGEIQQAAARYGERLKAAASGVPKGDAEAARQAMRATLSGFDLDFDELEGWISLGAAATYLSGSTPKDALVTGALSGVAVGLLVAEARAKDATTRPTDLDRFPRLLAIIDHGPDESSVELSVATPLGEREGFDPSRTQDYGSLAELNSPELVDRVGAVLAGDPALASMKSDQATQVLQTIRDHFEEGA